MVGLGRVMLAKRERPIMLAPMGNGLRGMTLRYTHEVRSSAEVFAGIPDLALPDEMLEVAAHILETKTADFRPRLPGGSLSHRAGLHVREKQGVLPKSAAAPVRPSAKNVIDLMDALKRESGDESPQSARKGKSPRLETTPKPPLRDHGPGPADREQQKAQLVRAICREQHRNGRQGGAVLDPEYEIRPKDPSRAFRRFVGK
jgi:non-homologous end joining protein Ku